MSELVALRIADVRPASGFRPLLRPIQDQRPASVQVDEGKTAQNQFDEGYRLGQQDAGNSFAEERARYRALISACEALQPEPSEALALLIAESVELLVRMTVGEVEIDRDTLLSRARRAAALAGDLDGARLLHIHPDDLALVGAKSLPLAVVADASIPRGSLRVEHPAGSIEDGVAVHLEALREQLGLKDHAE
jgi:flagellar assembly protein FliH